ncbi:hypothetical protein ACI6QG_15970 [Roseococcus sp. DSY-14]|uniref:hypothetical protein n=1 Tax=Roseococcus sp. DSY-14 TaxID=3369650 RepID=UPI00387B71FF
MDAARIILLTLLLAPPAAAQPAMEEFGAWTLRCVADRMTDRTACTLRHRDWVERPGAQPGLQLEVIARGGRLLPAVTARDLPLEGAARALLALAGVAQLRLDAHPMMELPCALEGRSLVCAPRPADAARAAEELPGAARALVRMSGLGAGTAPGAEPVELRLSGIAPALERFRRLQPPGAAPPPPGLDLRELLERLRALLG